MQTLEESLLIGKIGTPNRINKQQKIDNLIDYLFNGHLTFSKAAEKAGLPKRTAYRYFNIWKQTQEAQMIDSEWWSLYLQLKNANPEKALECLTRLKYRMTTEKHEVKQEIREIKLEWKSDAPTPNQLSPTP